MLGLVLALSKSPRKEECSEDNRGHVPSCVCHNPHGRFPREESVCEAGVMRQEVIWLEERPQQSGYSGPMG